MIRFKPFLMVLWLAACSSGGGGGTVDGGHSGGGKDGGGGGGGGGSDGGTTPDAPGAAATNDHCADATAISLATMHSTLTASVVGATADLAAPCGTAGTADVFYKFTLTRRQLVYADAFGATGNNALYFASSCSTPITGSNTTGDAVCSAGACNTDQAQVTALLDPGTYYLVYAGAAGATINFQHVEVGTGNVIYVPPGASTVTGTTSGFGTLYACDAAGAENTYWWNTCPSNTGGTATASTCGSGTDFDTILSFQVPGGETTYCDDDTCSFQSTVGASLPAGAGLYVIAVDGFSQSKQGNYSLALSRP